MLEYNNIATKSQDSHFCIAKNKNLNYCCNKFMLFLMNNNISAYSAVHLFLLSSYRIPAPENNLSDGTLVGGEQR